MQTLCFATSRQQFGNDGPHLLSASDWEGDPLCLISETDMEVSRPATEKQT